MKRVIKDYLSFSRRERIAAIVLLLLIGGLMALPYFFGNKKKTVKSDAVLQQQMALLQKSNGNNNENTTNNDDEAWHSSTEKITRNITLFEFDPNTLDATGWEKLGLHDKTIHTLLNYRNKGGKFRTPEDIRKIWGLKKEEADRIIPYARISATENHFTTKPTYLHTVPAKAPAVIDINTATIDMWKLLPGLTGGLPYRILKFRDKLGGFISIEQVRETYDMTDSIFTAIKPYLRLESSSIKKININTADNYELGMHPYISNGVAKAIVIYRQQHGSYQKVEDVKKIVFIKEEMFKKMEPYLTVE